MKCKILNLGAASLLTLGFTFGISAEAEAGRSFENNCKQAFDAVQEAFTHNIYGQKAATQLFKATKYKITRDIMGSKCTILVTNTYTKPLTVMGYLKTTDSDGVSQKLYIGTENSVDPGDVGVLTILDFYNRLEDDLEKVVIVQNETSTENSFVYSGAVPAEHYSAFYSTVDF